MEIRKDILMKDIEIRELFRNREEYAGKEIVVRGWVRGNRASNQFVSSHSMMVPSSLRFRLCTRLRRLITTKRFQRCTSQQGVNG